MPWWNDKTATFWFERLEEKGSQEPSEVETTPFGGGTRLVCPSFFLPSILLAVGKTGQDDNERGLLHSLLKTSSALNSVLHSPINGLPTCFHSLQIPQIHLTQLKISSWVSISTLYVKKIPNESETVHVWPHEGWDIQITYWTFQIPSIFCRGSWLAGNMFCEK